MSRKEIVIVCGYGCHLNRVYKKYLGRVVKYAVGNPVSHMVLCGGFSQLATSARSEAQVMEEFLRPKIFSTTTIIRDDDSLTTRDNLENVPRLIVGFANPDEYSLVIFCGAIWALKVRIIAEEIFPDYELRLETYDISSRGEAKEQLLSTLLEVAGLYLPFLAYLHRHQRKKRAKRI